MSLSCSCDYDDCEYFFEPDEDFSVFSGAKPKRCESCRKKIFDGETVLKMHCFRYAEDEERDDTGEDYVDIPDEFHCEKCGEIFLNLKAAGYCFNLGDDMQEALMEYQEMTGFKKSEAGENDED